MAEFRSPSAARNLEDGGEGAAGILSGDSESLLQHASMKSVAINHENSDNVANYQL